MHKLVFLFITFMMISACGSADILLEDIEDIVIDTITYFPNDSTKNSPKDTIINGKDTSVIKDSTITDSLTILSSQSISYKKLFTIKSNTSKSNQGLAIYGDELFNFHDSNNVIDVYNLKSYKKITSIELEPSDEVHCNTVSFSSEFYSINDKYPLLYVQQSGNKNKTNVYRIENNDNSYSIKKINTISYSPCSHSLTAIDKENNRLYILYANNGRYITFTDYPQHQDDISIDLTKTKKTYSIYIPKVVQDCAFDNNNLYFICGTWGSGELWIINFLSKTAKIIDITKFGLNAEPEGLDIYEGTIIISFINKTVYSISLQ